MFNSSSCNRNLTSPNNANSWYNGAVTRIYKKSTVMYYKILENNLRLLNLNEWASHLWPFICVCKLELTRRSKVWVNKSYIANWVLRTYQILGQLTARSINFWVWDKLVFYQFHMVWSKCDLNPLNLQTYTPELSTAIVCNRILSSLLSIKAISLCSRFLWA